MTLTVRSQPCGTPQATWEKPGTLCARVPTRCSGRERGASLGTMAGTLQELARVGEVVPLPPDAYPSRRHSSGAGLQVVPGTSVCDPAGGHRTGCRIQIVRIRAQRQPSALLSTRRGVVVPRVPVKHPPGLRTPIRAESVYLRVDGERRTAFNSAIRVPVAPAAPVVRPRSYLRGRIRLRAARERHRHRVTQMRGVAHLDTQRRIAA